MSHVYCLYPFMSQFVWCRYVLYSVHVLFCSILHRLVRCCYALCFPLFCSSNSRKHVTVSYRCWIELFRCMRNSLTLDGNIALNEARTMYTIYIHPMHCIQVHENVFPCVRSAIQMCIFVLYEHCKSVSVIESKGGLYATLIMKR